MSAFFQASPVDGKEGASATWMQPDEARDRVPWPHPDSIAAEMALPVCIIPGSSVAWFCWVLPADADTSFVDSWGGEGVRFYANDLDEAVLGIEHVAKERYPAENEVASEPAVFEGAKNTFEDDGRPRVMNFKKFNRDAFISGRGSRECQGVLDGASLSDAAAMLARFPVVKATEDKNANYVLAKFLELIPSETMDAMFSNASAGCLRRFATGKFSYRLVRNSLMLHGHLMRCEVADRFCACVLEDSNLSFRLSKTTYGRYVFDGALRSSWEPFARAAADCFLKDARKALKMPAASFFLVRMAVKRNPAVWRDKVDALRSKNDGETQDWRWRSLNLVLGEYGQVDSSLTKCEQLEK
jgi:hypothetical protein